MPRISKKLPDRRADYSFGDLVFWHLFVFGSRPNIDPSAKAGRKWEPDAICRGLRITDRTLRNWLADRHFPDSVIPLERELFGNNSAWDDARLELADALSRTRASKKSRKSRLVRWFTGAPAKEPVLARLPPPASGEAVDPVSGNVRKITAESSASEPEKKTSTGIVPYGEASGDRKSSEKEEARDAGGKLPSTIPSGQLQKPSAEDVPPRPKRRAGILPAILFPEWRRSREEPRDQEAWQEQDREEPSRWQERAEDERTGGLDPRPSTPRPGHPYRKIAALAVAAVTVLLGMYVWSIRPFEPKRSSSGPATGTPTTPVSPKPETRQQVASPPPQLPAASPRTEAQQRAEEEQRVMEKTVAAMKAAHGTEMREQEQKARQLDREGAAGAAARAQRDREWNAKQVAGMGYRLLEYTGVTGTSIGQVQTETVYDCALSCLADKCDAFAWFRDERTSGPRTCYRYRAPVNFYDNPGYTAGKKSSHSQLLLGRKLALAGDEVLTAQLIAQAASAPDQEADDVTHCPNGPVKVTGFDLTCDAMLVGGTTLGSHRLSWTVANINECARKCQPIRNCVGFTYNAAQQGGHSCVLFGPTPEKREDMPGWISGERPQQ